MTSTRLSRRQDVGCRREPAARDLVDAPARRRVEEALRARDAAAGHRAVSQLLEGREESIGVEDPLRRVRDALAHMPF